MTSARADLVRRGFDALNRDDLAGLLAGVDPDVEFQSLIMEAETGSFHGHAGVREWWSVLRASLEDLYWDVDELTEVEDQVVVGFQLRGRGVGSGAAVEQRMWQVIEIRDDRVIRWRVFRTREDALEAATSVAGREAGPPA